MTKKKIEAIIKEIVITKTQGADGKASRQLYKARYGKNWKKYYPTAVTA